MKKIFFLLITALILTSCAQKPVAEFGDTITIEYKATLADGSKFDDSQDYDIPTTFTIGNREVLVGLERAVLEMHEGEQKKVLLSPEAAYGLNAPEKIELIPLEEFPNLSRVRIGMILPARDRVTGEEVEGRIINVTPEGIIVDFNHPLAGQAIWMDITLLKIERKE